MTTGTEGSAAPVTDAPKAEPAATAGVGNVLADAPAGDKPADKAADATDAPKADAKPAEGKPADKPAEGEKPKEGEEGDKPKEGAPEQYADFTLPEGVSIDEAKATEFKEFAKANNLTQDAAQALVDRHVEALKEVAHAPYKLWEDTQKEWQAEIKKDPEIGGAKYEENIGYAAKALDAFGGPKLREALSFTGAGNNPEIVRAFVRVGKAMSEGGFVGGRASNTLQSEAAKMYPTMNQPK